MNDKEKLISLLILTDPNPYTCESESGSCELTTCTECRARSTADLLISHGVTVQEWISVYDELPETGGYVVCIAARNPFSRLMPMVARIEKNGWVNPITEQYISEVTHWMPMPQPPKGE